MISRRLFLLLAAVSVTVVAAPASAATFRFVGSSFRSCWEDTEGFTPPPDLQPIPLPAGTPPGTHFLRLTNASFSQVVILDTNGTVTVTENTLTSIRDTTTGRVVSSQVPCSGTFTFDQAAQRLNTTLLCNFTNTIGGTSTGTIATQTTYQIAGTTLVRVEPATPVVETINVVTGTGAPFSYQRVCTTSGALHYAP